MELPEIVALGCRSVAAKDVHVRPVEPGHVVRALAGPLHHVVLVAVVVVITAVARALGIGQEADLARQARQQRGGLWCGALGRRRRGAHVDLRRVARELERARVEGQHLVRVVVELVVLEAEAAAVDPRHAVLDQHRVVEAIARQLAAALDRRSDALERAAEAAVDLLDQQEVHARVELAVVVAAVDQEAGAAPALPVVLELLHHHRGGTHVGRIDGCHLLELVRCSVARRRVVE